MEDEGMGEAASLAVQKMAALLEEVAATCYFRNAFRKQFSNLSRRIKLLAPMLEELKERSSLISAEAAAALILLREALESARDLLILGSEGSKICMVLERDAVMKRFQGVTAQLEQSLGAIPFDKLDLPDEVQEQIELVGTQFRRAKERVDALDDDLYNDLVYSYNKDGAIDPPILRRLADNLQLMTISDLKQESLALHEMVLASGGRDPGESIEKTSMLLKKIKDFVQTQDPEIGAPTIHRDLISGAAPKLAPVPDDFRCPISLELMQDPVIVATGQTYDRGFIEQWLAAGHDTCPKTQQTLSSRSLTPNYVLRSLISRWCEENGVDPPKPPARSSSSSREGQKIEGLVRKLSSQNPQDQLAAAAELRLLAKHNAGNRLSIAEAGAIPLLVGLLASPDPMTQEHAVTALLNLSICEENKAAIVSYRAVPGIVYVLKTGTMAARENAAAALFSLSVVDENKITIGASGAIPALVSLLADGGRRGKKDAATALFSLCIYQGNKGKAVRAGAVSVLLAALADPAVVMTDEAMAVLAVLASHPEGKAAIGAADAVPLFVGIIGSGSPRNRENAAAILVHLCRGEHQLRHLAAAMGCGVLSPLRDLAQNGTDRGKRKAAQLLDRLNRLTESQAETSPDQGQLKVQLPAS